MATKKKAPEQKVQSESFGPHLSVVLKEMCRRVKAPYTKIDFKSPEWFRQYKWTNKEEESFEKWMTTYLVSNKAALKELCGRTYVNKAWCLKAAKEFTFMYGWVLSDYPT